MLSRKRQEELKEKRAELNYPKAEIQKVGPDQLLINQQLFTIKENFREAVDLEAIADRYMDVLDSYDYVVGDWSYEQLRLKGFYDNDARVGTLEQKIKHLPDYLLEYASFGAAYFVLTHERDHEEVVERNDQVKQEQKKVAQEAKPHHSRNQQNRLGKKKQQHRRKNEGNPQQNRRKQENASGKKRQQSNRTNKNQQNRNQSFNIVNAKDEKNDKKDKRLVKKKVVSKRQHSFSIKEKENK